jgi:hypothetical protein
MIFLHSLIPPPRGAHSSGSVWPRCRTAFGMTNTPSVISSGSEKSFSTQKQTMIMAEPQCLSGCQHMSYYNIFGTFCASIETLQSSADKNAAVEEFPCMIWS